MKIKRSRRDFAVLARLISFFSAVVGLATGCLIVMMHSPNSTMPLFSIEVLFTAFSFVAGGLIYTYLPHRRYTVALQEALTLDSIQVTQVRASDYVILRDSDFECYAFQIHDESILLTRSDWVSSDQFPCLDFDILRIPGGFDLPRLNSQFVQPSAVYEGLLTEELFQSDQVVRIEGPLSEVISTMKKRGYFEGDATLAFA